MPETNSHLQDNEQLLIKACLAGERPAQERLYQMYARKMMGVCSWYAHNRQEAEEILQDGFLRVFTYLQTYKRQGPLEAWIRKIMVNAALFKYRNKSMQLKPVIELDVNKHDTAGAISILNQLDEKEMLMLVQQLTPAYRMVFSLYVLEGYKHREIAAMLGISEGTSKSNLADARVWLQKACLNGRPALTTKKKTAVI